LAVSRRRFLQHGALAAAACAASPLSAFALQHPIGDSLPNELPALRPASVGAWQDHAAALEGITRNMFSSAVGTAFKALPASDAQPVWLTLHAVEDLPRLTPANPASLAVPNRMAALAPATNGFILRFGSSTPLSQESYLLQHDGLGSFALFLVPEAGGQTFAATVNRLDAAIIVAIPVHAGIAEQTAATSASAASPGTGSLLPAGIPAVRSSITQE